MTIRTDNRLNEAPMVPVNCRRCGAEVQVRKSSWNQTSVQWTDTALKRCEERCAAIQLTCCQTRTHFLACSALSESIVDATRTGALTIIDEGPDVRA